MMQILRFLKTPVNMVEEGKYVLNSQKQNLYFSWLNNINVIPLCFRLRLFVN